jgi:transcription elongation GreA/GreB family factor
MADQNILTEEGKQKLEDELHYLETEKRAEVGERIRIAREFGDISENSEYDDAKNEQGLMEARIAEITNILANATVVATSKRSGKVTVGCTVTVDMGGKQRDFTIVGAAESDVRDRRPHPCAPEVPGQDCLHRPRGRHGPDPALLPRERPRRGGLGASAASSTSATSSTATGAVCAPVAASSPSRRRSSRCSPSRLRPLPEKFHGLTDREVRYRQRYVDLIMNPEVRDGVPQAQRHHQPDRRYMEADGYIEVETPMMHAILGGANAKPFVTHFNALDRDFYLRIATELPLKRLIVGGMERVFEIGRQFRNEGMDLTHNPEFTSMEAYCAYSDLDGMKELTEGLFKAIAARSGLRGGPRGHHLPGPEDRHERHLALHAPLGGGLAGGGRARRHGHARRAPARALRRQRHRGRRLGRRQAPLRALRRAGRVHAREPHVCLRLPEEVSPLAKRKADDPRLTDRFELVICGHEYANAFTELNDPVDQAGRFAEQVAAKGMATTRPWATTTTTCARSSTACPLRAASATASTA